MKIRAHLADVTMAVVLIVAEGFSDAHDVRLLWARF